METRQIARWIGMSLILLVSGIGSVSAWEVGGSEIDAGKLSLGGRGAYYDPKDADEGTWHGGAQLRYYMTPVLGLEGSVDYRQSDFGATEIHVYPVQASLLAYLMPGKPVSPFLLAGPGWYFTTVEGPGGQDDTEHRFGFHAGGGLQFFINKFWSIDGTYRYIWVEDINSRDTALVNRDFDDEGHMFTAALNLHF